MAFVQKIQAKGDVITLTLAAFDSTTPEDRTDEAWEAIEQMCRARHIQRSIINQQAAKLIAKVKDTK